MKIPMIAVFTNAPVGDEQTVPEIYESSLIEFDMRDDATGLQFTFLRRDYTITNHDAALLLTGAVIEVPNEHSNFASLFIRLQ